MSNICDFEGILKTECDLQHLTRNCRIKNLREMRQMHICGEQDFKYEGEKNENILLYEQVFGDVSERRESKCRALLMKHHRKVTVEQVIILQKVQQLKTKNG